MISLIKTRYKSTKNKYHHKQTKNLISSSSLLINISHIINLVRVPILSIYYLLSMSMFYQVMGAIRCPKIKKHAGIKLRPLNKAKDPFMPNDMLIYTCESTDSTQTIKCLDDGRWNEIPHCPDPANNTCPELGQILHGTSNSTGQRYKVGTIVAFRCENELTSNFLSQTTTTAQSITTTNSEISSQIQQNISVNSEIAPVMYNLTGHRLLKCLPSSKWNNPTPTCIPIMPEPQSNVSFVLTSTIVILIPILIIITLFHLFMRWRKRQQQRERWKQYFTDYKYRHSKTSITFGMRPSPSNVPNNPVPVTDL